MPLEVKFVDLGDLQLMARNLVQIRGGQMETFSVQPMITPAKLHAGMRRHATVLGSLTAISGTFIQNSRSFFNLVRDGTREHQKSRMPVPQGTRRYATVPSRRLCRFVDEREIG